LKHEVTAGDGGALLDLLGSTACSKPLASRVTASIAVERRHRRAKTDAIDGETLLRTLMAWARGERRVCSMAPAKPGGGRPPPSGGSAAFWPKNLSSLPTGIRGLLSGQGIYKYDPLAKNSVPSGRPKRHRTRFCMQQS
jgi:hypothetical protein